MILYKYLRREHLLTFKTDGSILINTLYNLRQVEHEPVRDALEGHHQIRIRSTKQPLEFSVKEFQKMIPVLKTNRQSEGKASVFVENGAQFNMQIANTFVFCTSLRLDDSLFKRFGYDTYYKITDPLGFATILFEKLNQVTTIMGFKLDTVRYLDKPIIMTRKNKERILSNREDPYWNACFTKPRKFSAEREFRMAFVPQFTKEITPIILTCPELRRLCAFH